MAEAQPGNYPNSGSFYLELFNNVQGLEGQAKEMVLLAFVDIHKEIYEFTEQATSNFLFGPNQDKVYAVIARDKVSNSVLATILVEIYIVENLDNDSSFTNTFIIPFYVISVYEKARKHGLAKVMVEVIEEAYLKDYSDKNIIDFNAFVSPYSFRILTQR